MSKGPETGMWVPCLWNSKEAGMAGTEEVEGQREGIEELRWVGKGVVRSCRAFGLYSG